MKQVLLLYEGAVGQKINFDKSTLSFGPGVRGEVKLELQQLLGFRLFRSMKII